MLNIDKSSFIPGNDLSFVTWKGGKSNSVRRRKKEEENNKLLHLDCRTLEAKKPHKCEAMKLMGF